MRPPHRPWAFRFCRACWVRPARDWHHWLWYARWSHESVFRGWVQRRAPVVALCRPCHHRITRWDRFPSWPAAGILVWLVVVLSWVVGVSVGLVVAGAFVVGLAWCGWLPLVTFAGLVFGWARNVLVVGLVVVLVRVFG